MNANLPKLLATSLASLLVGCASAPPSGGRTTEPSPPPASSPAAPSSDPSSAAAVKPSKPSLLPSKVSRDEIREAMAAEGWQYTSAMGDPGKGNIVVGFKKDAQHATVSVRLKAYTNVEDLQGRGQGISTADGDCILIVEVEGDPKSASHLVEVLTGSPALPVAPSSAPEAASNLASADLKATMKAIALSSPYGPAFASLTAKFGPPQRVNGSTSYWYVVSGTQCVEASIEKQPDGKVGGVGLQWFGMGDTVSLRGGKVLRPGDYCKGK
jgi:hypothetical protein